MMLQLNKCSNRLYKTGGVSDPTVRVVDVTRSNQQISRKKPKRPPHGRPLVVKGSGLGANQVGANMIARMLQSLNQHRFLPPTLDRDGRHIVSIESDPSETGREFEMRLKSASIELGAHRSVIRAFMDAQRIQYITMGDSGGITTITGSAGGTIANVFPLDFSVSTNQASLANLFDEYRMHSARCEFIPLGLNVSSTVAGVINPVGDGVSVVDLDSATALVSYVAAVAFDSRKRFSIVSKNLQEYVAHGIPDRAWTTTSAPVISAWCKYFFTGMGVSLTFGRTDVWLIMEFRMGF